MIHTNDCSFNFEEIDVLIISGKSGFLKNRNSNAHRNLNSLSHLQTID